MQWWKNMKDRVSLYKEGDKFEIQGRVEVGK